MTTRRWNILIVALAACVLACALLVVVASFAGGVGAQGQAPPFTARWNRPGVATLRWSQPPNVRETCVIRNTTLIGCWYDLPAGATGLTLGGTGPMDGSFRPSPHDVFTLTHDGAQSRAQLRGVVYLSMVRG